MTHCEEYCLARLLWYFEKVAVFIDDRVTNAYDWIIYGRGGQEEEQEEEEREKLVARDLSRMERGEWTIVDDDGTKLSRRS